MVKLGQRSEKIDDSSSRSTFRGTKLVKNGKR